MTVSNIFFWDTDRNRKLNMTKNREPKRYFLKIRGNTGNSACDVIFFVETEIHAITGKYSKLNFVVKILLLKRVYTAGIVYLFSYVCTTLIHTLRSGTCTVILPMTLPHISDFKVDLILGFLVTYFTNINRIHLRFY